MTVNTEISAENRCPQCGAPLAMESPDGWLSGMARDSKASFRCPACGATLARTAHAAPRELSEPKRSGNRARKRGPGFWWIFLPLLAVLVFSIQHFETVNWRRDTGQILLQVTIIAIISASLSRRRQWFKQIKQLLAWSLIFMVFLIGYSYRAELVQIKNRLTATLMPDRGVAESPGTMSFQVADDGQFYIRAKVNGTPLLFLADTGASHIVLSPAAARRLGYSLKNRVYDRVYSTANGTVRGSTVVLSELAVGGLVLKNVEASINGAPMDTSLLGMSFFNRLEGYRVRNGVLTIFWSKKQ